MALRPWTELVNKDDDGLAFVHQWIRESPHPAELLGCDAQAGRRTLEALQVSTRSPMGALAFHTGGLLIDHGWLRVLGAGCPRLPRTLDGWNRQSGQPPRLSEGLLVADDAIGGFFAWFNEPRTIHYRSPDTFEWEDLELGYAEWLGAMLSDFIQEFYDTLRWPGWIDEVKPLDGAHGLLVWPPLMTGGPDIGGRSRQPVPVEELWNLSIDLGRQLRDLPDGAEVKFVIKK